MVHWVKMHPAYLEQEYLALSNATNTRIPGVIGLGPLDEKRAT
jgi:hypothetical protein